RDKLLPYERTAPLGEWRNKVMLIADDNKQGSPDHVDPIGWGHLYQTVQLDTIGLPPHVDRVYVYLHTYSDGPGWTKPGAKADILKNVSDGVVLFNYVGHGSPYKIADESVLLDSDAAAFINGSRLSVFEAKRAPFPDARTNNMKYQLMGDAGAKLVLPRLTSTASLLNEAGDTVTTIQRGQTVTVVGQVLDHRQGNPVSFEGRASLLI